MGDKKDASDDERKVCMREAKQKGQGNQEGEKREREAFKKEMNAGSSSMIVRHESHPRTKKTATNTIPSTA